MSFDAESQRSWGQNKHPQSPALYQGSVPQGMSFSELQSLKTVQNLPICFQFFRCFISVENVHLKKSTSILVFFRILDILYCMLS